MLDDLSLSVLVSVFQAATVVRVRKCGVIDFLQLNLYLARNLVCASECGMIDFRIYI